MQRNSKECRRVKASPLTYQSGRRMNHYDGLRTAGWAQVSFNTCMARGAQQRLMWAYSQTAVSKGLVCRKSALLQALGQTLWLAAPEWQGRHLTATLLS